MILEQIFVFKYETISIFAPTFWTHIISELGGVYGSWIYSGSGGDSLSYHNGAAFSTIDKDNDEHSKNCAELASGAWWYKSCHFSHLNGLNYGTGESTPLGTGIGWRGFNGLHDSLQSDVMAIRPIFD